MNPDPLEQWLRTAHPNPDRIDCPPSHVLRDLAERRLPIGHPAVAHVDICSPCYQEFAQLRDARRLADKIKRRQLVTTLCCTAIGCGILLLMIAVATGSLFHDRRELAGQVVNGRRQALGNVLSLAPNLLRDKTGGQPNILIKTPGRPSFVLLLNVEKDAYPLYNVILQTETGSVVTNLKRMSTVPVQTGRAVSINVSSSLLEPGRYVLLLRGNTENRESQILNVYELLVK